MGLRRLTRLPSRPADRLLRLRRHRFARRGSRRFPRLLRSGFSPMLLRCSTGRARSNWTAPRPLHVCLGWPFSCLAAFFMWMALPASRPPQQLSLRLLASLLHARPQCLASTSTSSRLWALCSLRPPNLLRLCLLAPGVGRLNAQPARLPLGTASA